MEYSIDGLAKEFKRQAEQYDTWYDEWKNKYPDAHTNETKFNLPQALYVITASIAELQDAHYGTQKPN